MPPMVAPGTVVWCEVTTRDAFGNVAEVRKPVGAAADYFAVAHVGSAREVTVHDSHVSFVAGEAGTRAGIAIVLNGQRAVESTVTVQGDADDDTTS